MRWTLIGEVRGTNMAAKKDATGAPKPTPRTIAAGRKASRLTGKVTEYIWAATAAGEKLNEDFFEQVGERFSTGKTDVKKFRSAGNRVFGLTTKRGKRTPRAK